MYSFLLALLILSTMKSSIWAYERPSQRIRNQGNSDSMLHEGTGGNEEYNEGQRINVGVNRHTHTSTRVNLPENERLRNGHTTIRNYIDSSSNTKSYFNSSEDYDQDVKNNNKRKSQVYEDTSRMLYPTDIENFTIPLVTNHTQSRNCSFGLCEDVDDYPTERIKRILSQSELKKFFLSEHIIIDNRFGDSENLCTTISHTRFPKTAKNMQNKEQVIVNVDQYKQGVVFETCKEEGPCNYAVFPNNFTPICVQKYTVRKLMVLGKESDDTVFDDFKIPSCCVCMVKK